MNEKDRARERERDRQVESGSWPQYVWKAAGVRVNAAIGLCYGDEVNRTCSYTRDMEACGVACLHTVHTVYTIYVVVVVLASVLDSRCKLCREPDRVWVEKYVYTEPRKACAS